MPVPTLDRALWFDLLGLPFRHRGRGPDAYDCYGLVIEILRRQGITLFDMAYPDDEAVQAGLIAAGLEQWRLVEPGPGAVLLFRKGNYPNHAGVQIDHARFIHATETYGQVKLDYLARGVPPHSALIMGAYRHVSDH